MITIKNLRIDDPADPSVGISPSFWNIEGDLIFEDQETLNAFLNKLSEAWEYQSEGKIYFTYNKETENGK